jgi:hypothetical protein
MRPRRYGLRLYVAGARLILREPCIRPLAFPVRIVRHTGERQ